VVECSQHIIYSTPEISESLQRRSDDRLDLAVARSSGIIQIVVSQLPSRGSKIHAHEGLGPTSQKWQADGVSDAAELEDFKVN
jgi:hypothetical protein